MHQMFGLSPHLCITSIASCERDDWERFLFAVRGADAWHEQSFARTPESLSFSWGFHRLGGSLLERLDRFYVDPWIAAHGGTLGIIPGTVLSDHAPVSLHIQFVVPSARRRVGRIPDSVLSHQPLRDELLEIWAISDTQLLDPGAFIDHALLASSEICASYARQDRHSLIQREIALHESLSAIQRLMQTHPQDAYLCDRAHCAREELRATQEKRSEFTYHATVTHWIAKADRMNKDFFSVFRQRPPGSTLRALRDPSDTLQTDPDIVLHMATDYYEALFLADLCTEESLQARSRVWQHVQPVVTDCMSQALLAPFTEQELLASISAIDASACPGEDGLTRQFFLEFWDIVRIPLLQGFQTFFSTGSLPVSLCSGIISLIPKGGDHSDLRQWRPITLLSTVYKVLARMISARLTPLLPDLIHGSQTGFIQDRCILDNIFTFYEAVEWAKATSQPLAILLLDFEKAYDRVDWEFLKGTMLRMGFPPIWISGVAGLYKSASSAVTIGGFVGDPFHLSRSVRQGCPLTPYLFLFFAEALSSFLRSQAPQLRGLQLPLADNRRAF